MEINQFGQMLSDLGQNPEFARNIRGAFGRPDLLTQMAIASGDPSSLLQKQQLDAEREAVLAQEHEAQRQAEVMSRIAEWADGKEPSAILSQLLKMGVKPSEAVAVTKQLSPREDSRIGSYIKNPETGAYELAPGLPDPDQQAADRAARTFDTQQRMLDERDKLKQYNDIKKSARDPTGYINLGLDHPFSGRELEDYARRESGYTPRNAGNRKPTERGGGATYTVGDKTLTDDDIQETARKYGLSPEEVKRQLGIK